MKPSDEEQALASLLRSGRADPSERELRRLEQRLSPWLGPAPSVTPSGRAGQAPGSGFWKTVVFLAAIGFLVSSGVTRSPSEGPRTPAPLVAAAPRTAIDPPIVAPSSESTVSVLDLPNAPAAAASPAPHVNALPVERGAPAPLAEPVVTTEANPDDSPTSPVVAESESSFLRRAQSTLNSDPAAALALLAGHPARFPKGILVQERDVMAIDALARLGRLSEARARANAFRATYPRSAHESRIASILKEGKP